MLFVFVLAALAAQRVDPALEQTGAEDVYRAWAAAQGRAADACELVCKPFAEGMQLCFTREDPRGRVYYTRADGRTAKELEAAARGRAEAAVSRLAPVKVEGFETPYWMLAEGDGRDHAVFLHPDALRAKLGGEPVLAAPARGVVVAWVPGDVVFDKIVAVGVFRMFDTLPDPVSPRIYRWDGEKWRTWGEARAVPGVEGPAPTGGAPAHEPAATGPSAPAP